LGNISLPVLAWGGLSMTGQLIAVAVLPRTAGFTKPLMTVICCVFFIVGIGSLARLAYRGVELGIMIPVMATAIPLATVAIGILVYGESASPVKIAFLIGACGCVGAAAVLR
jgi:multidrug transporter EmrE-like cation transporter